MGARRSVLIAYAILSVIAGSVFFLWVAWGNEDEEQYLAWFYGPLIIVALLSRGDEEGWFRVALVAFVVLASGYLPAALVLSSMLALTFEPLAVVVSEWVALFGIGALIVLAGRRRERDAANPLAGIIPIGVQ